MKTDKKYVYDNVEVRLTGRSASKRLPSGRIDLLHEVTPTDSIVGTWKKWVRMAEMHEVHDVQS